MTHLGGIWTFAVMSATTVSPRLEEAPSERLCWHLISSAAACRAVEAAERPPPRLLPLPQTA